MPASAETGASFEAEYVAEQISQHMRFLHKSQALGTEKVLREDLADVWENCSHQDWDGYNALPVTSPTLDVARRFLMALPLGTKSPSVGALPDGSITFEWHHSRRHSLTVALTSDGDLHYAALIGPGNTRGTEPFFDDVPATVMELISKVYSC